MFRLKKNSGPEPDEKAEAPRPEPAEDAPAGKSPPRRAMPMPARLAAGPSFPIDVPRRTAELPPARSDAATAAREKCLFVGKDVRLKGEIFDCERVVIEGQADLTLNAPAQLQIGPSGVFRGNADVAEADISGQFAGDLLVRNRLTVRSTGRIEGTLRYGQIVIEADGRITGDVAGLNPEGDRAGTEGSPTAQASGPERPEPASGPAAGSHTGSDEFVVPAPRL
jgi:cytoskeletal protein CcmA (bactofilin family)